MPRIREFDADEVLQQAMKLFWMKGYVDTSMRDLAEHTGVAHAGLYAAFGNKRKLFLKSLDHYRDTVLRPMLMPVASPDSSRAQIEGFFTDIGNAMQDGTFAHGCFLCNTAVEFGDDGGPVLKQVRGNFERMLAAFEGAIGRARLRGEVRKNVDPSASASALVGAFAGAAVMLRAQIPAERAVAGLKVALEHLD